MAQNDEGERIDFEVCSCSGEDPEYPVLALQKQEDPSRGWQSPRFCEYPQEIGIRFLSPHLQLNQLQLLSHQSKISQRIELYVGDGPSYDKAHWTRLGYMSLDSNERTKYKAREMKSVFLQAQGRFLKMRMYQCYTNQYNLFNQVGIVALNFMGTRIPGTVRAAAEPPSDTSLAPSQYPSIPGTPPRSNPQRRNVLDSVAVPSPEPSKFDRTTASRLRELRQMKLEAIEREDYDEAKRIKFEEDELQEVGKKLAVLEAEKRRAVEIEDYDTAKMLKQRMEAIRSGRVAGDGAGRKVADTRRNDVVNDARHATKRETFVEEDRDVEEVDASAPSRKEGGGDVVDRRPLPGNEGSSARNRPFPGDAGAQRSPFAGNSGRGRPFPGDAGAWTIPDGGGDDAPAAAASSPSVKEDFGDGPHPLDGVEGYADLPIAPKLPQGKVHDAEPIAQAFGDYVARCAFSKKSWALRRAAMLKAKLEVGSSDQSDGVVFAGVLRLLKIAANDRVAQVFLAALELQEKMLDNPPSSMSSRSVADALKGFTDAIVARVCTGNSRVQKLARRTLMELAFHDVVGASAVAQAALKQLPRKQMKQPKAILARISVVQDLLKEHHADRSAGFGAGTIVSFVKGCKALENREGSVRDAGAQLITTCFRYYGDSVRQHFRGLSKRALSKLEDMFATAGGGGAEVVSAAPSADARVSRSSSRRNRKTNNRDVKRGGRGRGGRRRDTDRRSDAGAKEETTVAVVDDGDDDRSAPAPSKMERKVEVSPRKEATGEEDDDDGAVERMDVVVGGGGSAAVDDARSVSEAEEEGMDDVQPFTCPFCGLYDKSFDDEGLDTHFWKECPMLTSCPKCEQVIEICDLNEHLLEECAHKAECRQCPRCREAIAIAFFEVHTQRRKCLPASNSTVRCPLCHTDIGSTSDNEDPWKRHLLEEGCPKNPRILRSY